MEVWFAIASALVVIAGAPFYVYDILKGTTRPQRVTWFIWSVQGIVAFTSQVILHGGWSLLYIGLEALGNVLVFMLALHFGVGGWKTSDKVALGIALLGVLVSVAARQPVVALFGVVVADLSGVILTILKSYRQPESETPITWFALGTAGLLSGLAVGRLSFELLLYPLYLAVSCYAVFATIYLSKLIHFRKLQKP